MLAQGVIEYEGCISLRTADPFRLLEEIRDSTIVDLLLKPGRFEKKRDRFVLSALSSTQRVMLARLLLSRTIRPVK